MIAALIILSAPVVAIGTPAAHAAMRTAPATQPAKVVLTSLAPLDITATTNMDVGGRVSNAGFSSLGSVSVRLTLSAGPLTDRRMLRTVSEGAADFDGLPVPGSDVLVADKLGPGTQRSFRISIKASDLPLSTPGVYVLGVEAVGYGPEGYVVLGSTRTLLPWLPEPTTPVAVSWLWPLATWPGQTADDVFLGDGLGREVSPGGRLKDLLDVGSTSPGAISWVVDPQLLQATSNMSRGYLVSKGSSLEAGKAQAAATQWLAAARETLGSAPGPKPRAAGAAPPGLWSLPYSDIDADAVTRAGLDADVVRAVTTAPVITRNLLSRDANATIYWAPAGRLTPATLNLLASSGVKAVVVREGALPPVVPSATTPSSFGEFPTQFGTLRAVVIDTGLRTALGMPQANQTEILTARQRFLSELAFVSLEDPAVPRSLVVAPGSTRWHPNPRLLRSLLASIRLVSWARLTPLQDALPTNSGIVERSVADYPESSKVRELSDGYMSRIAAAQADLLSLRSVATDPAALTEPSSAALLRAESSAWRSRPTTGNDLLQSVQKGIDEEIAKVRIVPRDDVTFSGDRGSVPVTVANNLDSPVVVGVQLTGSPNARLAADAIDGITIDPGKRASVEVPVRLVGSDPLPVTVQLIDTKGQPFGAPSTMELRSTAYSRAALWVAIGAAVVLVLLVVFDIIRRARGRHRGGPTPATT